MVAQPPHDSCIARVADGVGEEVGPGGGVPRTVAACDWLAKVGALPEELLMCSDCGLRLIGIDRRFLGAYAWVAPVTIWGRAVRRQPEVAGTKRGRGAP